MTHRLTRGELIRLPQGELAERIERAVRYLDIGLPCFAFATLEGRPCHPMSRRIAPPPLPYDGGDDDAA